MREAPHVSNFKRSRRPDLASRRAELHSRLASQERGRTHALRCLGDAHDDDGDVVTTAAGIGGEHALRGSAIERALVAAENPTNVLVGHHLGESIRAEKKYVVRKRLVDDEVYLDRLRDSQRAAYVLGQRTDHTA